MGLVGLSAMELPAIAEPMIKPSTIERSNSRSISADQTFQKGLQSYSRNQYGAAIQSFMQALAQYRAMNDRNGERQVLNNLGLTYEALKNYPKAIDFQQQSLAIAIETKNRRGEEQSLMNLANAYHRMKDDTKAIDLFEQSLVLNREIGGSKGTSYSLADLGRIYAYFGDYPSVIKSQTQRLNIAREANNRTEESKTLESLGLAYSAIGDYPKSIESYQQTMAIYRESKSEKANIDRLLMSLGEVYQKSGNPTKAIESYQAISALSNVKYDLNLRIKVLGKLGVVFAKIGNFPQAEASLKSAIAEENTFRVSPSLSDANKILSAERQVANCRLLQQVLVRQNRIELALEVAEQGRSRALVDLMTLRSNTGTPSERANLSKAPNIDSIRRIAKAQKATLVEYSIISPEELYIWVVKPSGEVIFKISKLTETVAIDQLIADSRSSVRIVYPGPSKLAPKPLSDLDLTLQNLYEALIEPIVSELPIDPNQRVILLPQGELFLVPFAALQAPNGTYLIENHTLSTAPSIQTLQLTHEKAKLANIKANILVVGDPEMPFFEGSQLPALPGARQEAIDIAQLFKTQPLIGNQATKAAVLNQMNTASIVHLATHGLLNAVNNDVPGAIALASSAQDNGLLTASEIFDLQLTADLVVLSACDTGRGEIKGDGVIGLSRSFIAAGVPSVVVSLWAVNDRSTIVLMGDFYRNLQANPSKAQALRQAMLNTLKKYPNPRDWAAFTLVGESDRP